MIILRLPQRSGYCGVREVDRHALGLTCLLVIDSLHKALTGEDSTFPTSQGSRVYLDEERGPGWFTNALTTHNSQLMLRLRRRLPGSTLSEDPRRGNPGHSRRRPGSPSPGTPREPWEILKPEETSGFLPGPRAGARELQILFTRLPRGCALRVVAQSAPGLFP